MANMVCACRSHTFSPKVTSTLLKRSCVRPPSFHPLDLRFLPPILWDYMISEVIALKIAASDFTFWVKISFNKYDQTNYYKLKSKSSMQRIY